MRRNQIETRPTTEQSIDNIIFSPENDLALNAYKELRPGNFVLARTFRSGASVVESELSYLENTQGYIFCNPTTIISQSIRSKTISQLQGNDWSGQPSFIFTVQSNSPTTIANHGIASLNSFSSTEAINMMRRFAQLEGSVNGTLTLSQKMNELQEFLAVHWRDNIDKLKVELDQLEGKTRQTTLSTKTFSKPFEYFFHSTDEYNALLSSLETLHKALQRANNLTLVTRDVVVKPHPVAQIIHAQNHTEELPDHGNLSDELKKIIEDKLENNTKDKFNRIKSLLFRSLGSLKSSEIILDNEASIDRFASISPESKAKRKEKLDEESSIYDNYCNYLDTGARHNEFVSRVYPWEISGIEWGADKSSKLNAISDLIVTINKKIELQHEFTTYGITHPLFVDFMANKLSLEYPDRSYQEIKKLMSNPDMKTEQTEILEEIKLQLQNPVCIYEYTPVNAELTNISKMVAEFRASPNKESKSDLAVEHELVRQYSLLFEEGFRVHMDKLEKIHGRDFDGETDIDSDSDSDAGFSRPQR